MFSTIVQQQNTLFEMSQLLIFIMIWLTLFFLIHFAFTFKKDKKEDALLKTHIVALLHGVLSFIFSSMFINEFGIDFELKNSPLSVRIVSLSLGYFNYDLIICIIFGIWDWKLVWHHGLAIIGFLTPILLGKGVFVLVLALFLGESSNFPMHVRALLKFFYLKHTKIYELFDIMYFLIYIFARGVISPYYSVFALLSKSIPMFTKITFAAQVFLSFYFIYQMLGILTKKKKEYIERRSKGISLHWFSINPKISELDYTKKKSKANIF